MPSQCKKAGLCHLDESTPVATDDSRSDETCFVTPWRRKVLEVPAGKALSDGQLEGKAKMP